MSWGSLALFWGQKDEGEGPNRPVRAEGEEGLIMTHFWLRDWPRGQSENWGLNFEKTVAFLSLSLSRRELT